MSVLDKTPRWFLMVVAVSLFFLVGLAIKFNVSIAFADMNATKAAAFEAKNLSEANRDVIGDLKSGMNDMKTAQETFRREYREDRKDFYRSMNEMKNEILKAVKS